MRARLTGTPQHEPQRYQTGARTMSKGVEHVVTRVNDGRYVCDVCGQAGSERWAILHQFPSDPLIISSQRKVT